MCLCVSVCVCLYVSVVRICVFVCVCLCVFCLCVFCTVEMRLKFGCVHDPAWPLTELPLHVVSNMHM